MKIVNRDQLLEMPLGTIFSGEKIPGHRYRTFMLTGVNGEGFSYKNVSADGNRTYKSKPDPLHSDHSYIVYERADTQTLIDALTKSLEVAQ